MFQRSSHGKWPGSVIVLTEHKHGLRRETAPPASLHTTTWQPFQTAGLCSDVDCCTVVIVWLIVLQTLTFQAISQKTGWTDPPQPAATTPSAPKLHHHESFITRLESGDSPRGFDPLWWPETCEAGEFMNELWLECKLKASRPS
ncbi:hypothetical protein SRHO_G00030500 [Serrasalmus rhombeus]